MTLHRKGGGGGEGGVSPKEKINLGEEKSDEGSSAENDINSSRISLSASPAVSATAVAADSAGDGTRAVGRSRGSEGDEDGTNSSDGTASNGSMDSGRGRRSENDFPESSSPPAPGSDANAAANDDERPSDGVTLCVVVRDGDGSDVFECAPEAATATPVTVGKERKFSEQSALNGPGAADSRMSAGESRVWNKRNEIEMKHESSEISAHAKFVSRYDASFVSSGERHRLRPRHGRMPRQWLYDRCDGVSKYEEKPAKHCPMARKKRPPCRVCWPPIPLKWCPDIVEQNCWCERTGKRGYFDPENRQARVGLLSTALACNVAGLLLLCVCAVSMTEERFDILWAVPFTRVWVHFHLAERDINGTAAEYAVGLRAVALKHFATNQTEQVISFSEFCHLPLTGSDMYARAFVAPAGRKSGGDCNACEDTSKKIIPSLFLGMFSYLPTFITDINRMWATYDVNCQKFMASVFSWISLATSIYSWVNYNKNCFDFLNTHETTYLNSELYPTAPGSEDVFIIFTTTYHAGLGQVCLGLATFLKIIDIFCNIMVPTPTITRDHLEQVEYDWKYGPHSDDGDDDIGGGVNGQTTEDEEDAVKPRASVSD